MSLWYIEYSDDELSELPDDIDDRENTSKYLIKRNLSRATVGRDRSSQRLFVMRLGRDVLVCVIRQ